MLRTKTTDRQSLLTAALEGLELQKQRIDEQIREVRSMLGKPGAKQTRAAAAADSGPARTRRTLSPLARKRIAAAQKKRWAEYRKQRGDKPE